MRVCHKLYVVMGDGNKDMPVPWHGITALSRAYELPLLIEYAVPPLELMGIEPSNCLVEISTSGNRVLAVQDHG